MNYKCISCGQTPPQVRVSHLVGLDQALHRRVDHAIVVALDGHVHDRGPLSVGGHPLQTPQDVGQNGAAGAVQDLRGAANKPNCKYQGCAAGPGAKAQRFKSWIKLIDFLKNIK